MHEVPTNTQLNILAQEAIYPPTTPNPCDTPHRSRPPCVAILLSTATEGSISQDHRGRAGSHSHTRHGAIQMDAPSSLLITGGGGGVTGPQGRTLLKNSPQSILVAVRMFMFHLFLIIKLAPLSRPCYV